MKNLFNVLYLLVLFWESAHAMNRSLQSLQCEEALGSEEALEASSLPLEEFLHFLIDMEIYSIIDFVNLKKEEGLPDGVPDKPLQVYSELKGQWSILWKKIHDIRFPSSQEQGSITERRKLSSTELRALFTGAFNEWQEEERVLEEEEISTTEDRISAQDKMKDQILALMIENPYITVPRLAEQVDASITITSQTISSLKEEGRVKGFRIHNSRVEYWKVLQRGKSSRRLPQRRRTQRRATSSHHLLQEERKKRILFLMDMNPYIITTQIAERTSIPISTINNIITSLKKEGQVERVGTRQKGYWNVLQEGEESSPQEQRKKQILRLMFTNPHITRAQLAEQTGVSRSTIQKMISSLKEEKRLERIGAEKNGYWV